MSEKSERFDRLLQKLEALGHWFFYVTMRLFGHRGGRILLAPVVFTYVVFSRKVHRTVRNYLVHRFPGERDWQYFLYTFKNIYAFGNVLVDRGWLGVRADASFAGELIGYETIHELVEKGKGVVLLTAHVGNWQTALAHLDALPVTVHALMQYDRQTVAKHYFDLKGGERPFEIINVDGPFGGMVDASAALQRGEIITIMGDRFIKGSYSRVDFYGESVRLPDAAYVLAAISGAPVVVLLAAKTGGRTYQLKVWDHFYPEYTSRDEREPMLRKCAERYISSIEDYLKNYPFQWYNFYNFWEQ